jgi:hypothetical protein
MPGKRMEGNNGNSVFSDGINSVIGIFILPATEGLCVIQRSIGHPHQVQAAAAADAGWADGFFYENSSHE